MNVLVIGSGGREHALSWKIVQSSHVTNLYIAPGNAGTTRHGRNVDIDHLNFKEVKKFVLEQKIKLVIVGPEAPLVAGIQDFFQADPELSSVTLIGPTKEGAMLEGSKDFAKAFMVRHNIPTAKYGSFVASELSKAVSFLDQFKPPYVLKADGLAGGKGVVILDDKAEAAAELKEMLKGKKFGKASEKVVIEEFLDGIELSAFVITDGDSYKILPVAKDYKRIGEGDSGLNTGGMGAISPVPFCGPEFLDKINHRIIIPTIKGLKADGIKYQGFIFFGIIKVGNDPYVIEYNVRMGDPESEVVFPRIKSDLLDLFQGIADGTLSESDLVIDDRYAATVMLVSGGYPGKYETGKVITGLNQMEGSVAFHAGTKANDKEILSNGGRVLALTSFGATLEQALVRSYENAAKINFEGMYYRKDIGFDLKK